MSALFANRFVLLKQTHNNRVAGTPTHTRRGRTGASGGSCVDMVTDVGDDTAATKIDK